MMSNNKVVIYDDIETAPILRYLKFNNYMAMAAETGDNWEDMTTRVKRANGYILANDNESAFKELSNMLMVLALIKNEFSPTSMAYAVQVKSIDGVPCDDISEEGLTRTIQKLNEFGVSFDEMKRETERVKKKSLMSFKSFLKKLSMARI